jgi:hypothetical protein
MSEMIPSEQTGNKPNPLIRFLKVIWRLFLLLLTGIIVGAVVYFAFIQLYMNAVQTAQTSSERLNVVETASAQQRQLDAERLDQLSKRLSDLEKQQGKQSEGISSLEGKALVFDRAVDNLNLISKRVTTLEAALALNSQTDQELVNAMTAEEGPLMVMKREVKILKAMELVNRARLNLIQNNAGLARSDVESANQLLKILRDESPETQKATVTTWIRRLDLVLENLPAYPVVAADDLEIAWRMLVWEEDGVIQTQIAASPTAPVLTPALIPTLSQTAVFTASPTPTGESTYTVPATPTGESINPMTVTPTESGDNTVTATLTPTPLITP